MMETFTLEKVHYFRAKIDATHPKSFDAVVRYFQTQCGLSRGGAINAARRTYPSLYNAELQLFNQCKGPTPSHLAKRETPVHVMDMRLPGNGAPVITFRGL
jgi:hypothetical protein